MDYPVLLSIQMQRAKCVRRKGKWTKLTTYFQSREIAMVGLWTSRSPVDAASRPARFRISLLIHKPSLTVFAEALRCLMLNFWNFTEHHYSSDLHPLQGKYLWSLYAILSTKCSICLFRCAFLVKTPGLNPFGMAVSLFLAETER